MHACLARAELGPLRVHHFVAAPRHALSLMCSAPGTHPGGFEMFFNCLKEAIHGLQRFNRVNAKYGRDAFGEVYCIVTFADIPVGLVR